MRNLLPDKILHYENFADVVYSHFRSLRFGMKTCCDGVDPDLALIRKEIVDFQSAADGADLCEETLFNTVLPVCTKPTTTKSSGCCSFVFTQSVAADVWIIEHNLGIRPNVQLEDQNGTDIDGSVRYVSENLLTVTFSEPLAGTAYLS